MTTAEAEAGGGRTTAAVGTATRVGSGGAVGTKTGGITVEGGVVWGRATEIVAGAQGAEEDATGEEVTGSIVVLLMKVVGRGDGGETVLTFFNVSSLILEHVDIRLFELACRSRTL